MDEPRQTGTSTPPATSPRRPRRGAVVAVVALIAVLALLGGLIAWALRSGGRGPATASGDDGFERYRAGWESAMEKAGVDATFPAGPVELETLRPTGMRSFTATFTSEEVTSLLNVYPYSARSGGRAVTVNGASVGFLAPGTASVAGEISLGESAYDARIAGPVSFRGGAIRSPGATELTVEGFGVGGTRREQATTAILGYLNAYLDAAPGLRVRSAAVVRGGVRVEGSAPTRLSAP